MTDRSKTICSPASFPSKPGVKVQILRLIQASSAWLLALMAPLPASAIDVLDSSTGQLTSQVMVGDTKYTDVVVTVADVVSGPSGSLTFEENKFGPRPDTYDQTANQLIIPAMKVGEVVYRNVVIKIAEVVSANPFSEVLADSGFNGEIYPRDFKLFVADDLSSEVEQAYREHLQFAA